MAVAVNPCMQAIHGGAMVGPSRLPRCRNKEVGRALRIYVLSPDIWWIGLTMIRSVRLKLKQYAQPICIRGRGWVVDDHAQFGASFHRE